MRKVREHLKTWPEVTRAIVQAHQKVSKGKRKRTQTITFYGEFDPGSGRTLAACLIHASRARVAIHERRTGE